MRIPSPGETELLLPLHDGHFEQPMWGTFLARLRRHAGADLAALMIRPTDGSGVIELHDGTAQGTRLRALVIGREEAAGHRFGSMREGRAYGLDELVELGGDASALDGLTHLRSMRVSAGHALDAWLLLAGERSLGAGTAGLLTALAPHLRVALRTFAAMERDYFYPSLADRNQPRTWAEMGAKDAWSMARARAKGILETHHPTYLTEEQDRAIRAKFNILT